MLFPDNNVRKYQCFVCAIVFDDYRKMQEHIIEAHEKGREYLVCPLKHCQVCVRDLRYHFRCKHPHSKLPKTVQMQATVMYDVKSPNKRKKLPNFKEGYIVSQKNNGQSMHYRSNYEKEVYESLEKMGDVIGYEVEPIHIPYSYKGKLHKYFPDLRIHFSDGRVEIWEIKPSNQTVLEQNTAKFAAGKQYCMLRGWTFNVITEQKIQQLKKGCE